MVDDGRWEGILSCHGLMAKRVKRGESFGESLFLISWSREREHIDVDGMEMLNGEDLNHSDLC